MKYKVRLKLGNDTAISSVVVDADSKQEAEWEARRSWNRTTVKIVSIELD